MSPALVCLWQLAGHQGLAKVVQVFPTPPQESKSVVRRAAARRTTLLLSITSLVADERADCAEDMMGTDASLFHQFGGGTGAGHRADCQFNHFRHRAVLLREGFQYGFTESTLGPVILDDNDFVACFLCRSIERLGIDWFHRVGVDYTYCDPLA